MHDHDKVYPEKINLLIRKKKATPARPTALYHKPIIPILNSVLLGVRTIIVNTQLPLYIVVLKFI